jgi:hypothetical protein
MGSLLQLILKFLISCFFFWLLEGKVPLSRKLSGEKFSLNRCSECLFTLSE